MKTFIVVIVCIAALGILVPAAPAGAPPSNEGATRPEQKQGQVNEDTYIIGPEDVLFIHVWKEESLSRTIPVRKDGMISLPMIDDVKADGLTPLQLKELLISRMKSYIDSPTISVIVTEANSYRVFVSGQVRNPGVYRLRSETTLLQIIPVAGGFTEWADQKRITVIRKERGGEKRFFLNYKKIVEGESQNPDFVLKTGDTIIVP